MEIKSIESGPAKTRQEQLAELIKLAASQPGLNAVVELSRQEWFRSASAVETQLPMIERFGISTDTVTSLL